MTTLTATSPETSAPAASKIAEDFEPIWRRSIHEMNPFWQDVEWEDP